MYFLMFLGLVLFTFEVQAEEVEVPTVIIDSKGTSFENKLNEYSVFKSEKVPTKKLRQPDRPTLTEIVKDQVGVDNATYCANCGAKRLTINGLKGEHTSILVDGIPLHSAVSSFYGVDNIPSNGLAEIEVMRGAGASLTNPEAIGGTLNLITVDPLDLKNSFSTSIGVDDDINGKSENHSLMYGLKSSNKKFGILVGGQYSNAETWDVDNNNVAESPYRENYSFMSKTRFFLGNKNDFSARVGKSRLKILGGAADPSKPQRISPISAQDIDFEGGNIENVFTGNPEKITDWVQADRTEAALTGTHFLSSSSTLEWKLGYARQKQQSIYQHGFDYANIDNLVVSDVNYQWNRGQYHFFNFGTSFKVQRLRSTSVTLFEQFPDSDPRDIKKDSFDYKSGALYFQYSYLDADSIEFDAALRVDSIILNWLELDNKIEKTIPAPRLQLLVHHTDHLKQRVSYGLGYRAPLTFFESQHGNSESGYQVDINDLELAHSAVHSVSYNTPKYYLTFDLHYTRLLNMAYGFESFNQRIFYRNSEEKFNLWTVDFLFGYKPFDWWLIEPSIEFFRYEDRYKRILPTAAIEERIQLKSTIEKQKWSHSTTLNFINSRDLSKYGSYPEHYLIRDQAIETGNVFTPSLERKNQKAPAYFTLDMSFSYAITKSLNLGIQVNNLFDYTQTSEGDSPSTWHWHFNHAHYDGLHTWGPNTGRQYHLSLSGDF